MEKYKESWDNMRKLASIQRITDIQPIQNADKIEVASVLGWKVVIKKGEFSIGDLCIYFEVDSILPALPEFEFLKKNDYRLKTMRMRGQLSQGLCWNVNILPEDIKREIGTDVTEVFGVQKYEEPFPEEMVGVSKRFHPTIVRKSGEVRVQAEPRLLEELKGKRVAVTTKIEGVSTSFIRHNGEIDVCSHTHSLLENDKSVQWQMAKKYDILDVLKQNGNIAIQGETAGPGIFGNPMGLKEVQFFVFRITNTETQQRYTPDELVKFCNENNLQHVPIPKIIEHFDMSLEEVLELAKGNYEPSGTPQEGVVLVPMELTYSEVLCDWLSMKVINNDYLLGEWKKRK
jgi:RNA ligase (TIGR02306 family)